MARGLRSGESGAFEQLWREHSRSVRAYAFRVVGDAGAAEDVCQQVFAELWERRAAYDPERGSVQAWIMTVARTRTIDYLRRRRPEPRDPAVVDAEQEASQDSGGAEAIVERIAADELLLRIPTEEAGLLRMRFYDGLSQREIAARTQIPLGTVKMRMVQALERLRGLIDGEAEHA
jgi:RNA polymerase sigma-70 factor, ECF subfamily